MTVEELIDALSKFPPTAEVSLDGGGDWGYSNITEIKMLDDRTVEVSSVPLPPDDEGT